MDNNKTISLRVAIDANIEITEEELEQLKQLGWEDEATGAANWIRLICSQKCIFNSVRLINCKANTPAGCCGAKWPLPALHNGQFYVDTPDGTMRAYKCGDFEFPGIGVDLVGGNSRHGGDLSLSLTEYIPGGESVCGYDPNNPALNDEEFREVPIERMCGPDGELLTEGELHLHHRHGLSVSPGFVTRAWPNESENEEYHKRVFAYGYKKREAE